MLHKVVLSLLSLPINIYFYPNIKQKHLAYFLLLTHALHNFDQYMRLLWSFEDWCKERVENSFFNVYIVTRHQ